jgi:hypothetical protein
MHQRVVIAADRATLTDSLHIAWAMVTLLFMMLIMGFEQALGKQFGFLLRQLFGLSRVWLLMEQKPRIYGPADSLHWNMGTNQYCRVHVMGRGVRHRTIA